MAVLLGQMPERLVLHVVQLAAGQHARERQFHRLGDVPSHFLVIAGDDLELHPALGQIGNDLLHIRLGRIEEEQEAGEGQVVFIGASNRSLAARPPSWSPRPARGSLVRSNRCSAFQCRVPRAIIQWTAASPDCTLVAHAQNVFQCALGDEGMLALGHWQ